MVLWLRLAHIELLASWRLLLIRELVASRLVIYSGCAWPVLPLLLVEGVLTNFVGGSLAEAGHARSEEPKRP